MNASFFRGPVGLVTLGLVSVTVCVLLLLPAVGHGYLEAPGDDWIIVDDAGDGGGGTAWKLSGNNAPVGSVLGTTNLLALDIIAGAMPRMQVLPAGGVNVVAGTANFPNNLTVEMFNSLIMPQGTWDGSGAGANPFDLTLTAGNMAVAVGDVNVALGNLNMFSGFWDGSGTGANPFALELTMGDVDVMAGDVNVAAGAINMPFGAGWNAANLGSMNVQGPAMPAAGNLFVSPPTGLGGGNVIVGPPTNNSAGQYNNLLVDGNPAQPGSGSVGIGPVAQGSANAGIPQARLHVEGVAGVPETLLLVEGTGNAGGVDNAGVPYEHVAVFRSLKNPADAASTPDGIAIELELAGAAALEDNNFITFFTLGSTNSHGAISRMDDGGGGTVVTFESLQGGDFAEGLPKLVPEENLEPGMIVGVYSGYVTKDTVGADHIMVISTAPAFLGKAPPDGEEDNYGVVAFMGQVPVLVRAPVSAGDFILASGMGDGTAVAVNPAEIVFEDIGNVVGTAWTALEGGLLGYVDVVVGVTNAVGGGQAMAAQLARVKELQIQLDQTQRQLAALSRRMAQLETAIAD